MGVKTYKCPNCGGDLQLDENFEHGFCIYFGTQLCIEDDNLSVLDVISKINEERAKKLDVLHQTSDYEGMFAECQSILSTDASCGIAYAYAAFAIAHGANRMTELAKECYVMQQTMPNPMNIALPDLNNTYFKLQNSVATYCSKAMASDDQTSINMVFDLIEEISNDFASGQSKQGVYLPHGMIDCQNAPSLSISTLQDYIAMKLASFMKIVFAEKDKAVKNSELISQRTKQSSELMEQVVASPNNARFIPVISAVVMGMKYNYFDTKIDDSMNLSLRESDFNKQLKAQVEEKRRAAANAINAENYNDDDDSDDEDDEDDDKSRKTSVVVNKNSGKAKKANYFTNLAKHFKQVPMIYICFVMFAAGFITICATKIDVAIPIVIVAVAWICMFVFSLRSYKRSVCSACKSSLEYGDYSYRCVGSEIKRNSAGESRYDTYEFTRICPNCGKEKVFTKKLLAATHNYEKGTYNEPNLNLDMHATPGKSFTKADVIGLNIIGGVVTVIGIVLLIVGIVLGSGTEIVKNPKGEDPKDYYETYECVGDGTYAYASITFEEDGKCFYRSGNSGNEYEYEFVSSEYACKHLTGYKNSSYSDCDALFVYQNSYDHSADILWFALERDDYGNYTLYNGSHKYVITSTDGRADSVDPQNYYYKYKLDNYNYITFDNDGSCEFVNGGESQVYYYTYVQQEYVKRFNSAPVKDDCDVIIVWVNSAHTRFYTFYVTGQKYYKVSEIMLTGGYYYTKV